MSIISDTKKAFDYIRHPYKTGDSYTVKSALKFYYRAMIIPMIASIVIALIVGSIIGTGVGALNMFSGLSALLGLGTIGMVLVIETIFILLTFIVFIPVGMIINAAIFQLFSKFIFRIWKGDYSKTFAAAMYGTFPVMLFFWLILIPIIGIVILAFSIWGIVVQIIALSKQHDISKGRAFIGWIIPVVIFIIIDMLLSHFLIPLLI